MKETITREMIKKCQDILKSGTYDLDKFVVEVGPQAPCSTVQGLFPDILDLALEHLSLKASHQLVEYEACTYPKTNNVDVICEGGKIVKKLLNNPLPKYDWDLVT